MTDNRTEASNWLALTCRDAEPTDDQMLIFALIHAVLAVADAIEGATS